MKSRIRKVYACLAVTCHLHLWQNDRDLLHATAVPRGWNVYLLVQGCLFLLFYHVPVYLSVLFCPSACVCEWNRGKESCVIQITLEYCCNILVCWGFFFFLGLLFLSLFLPFCLSFFLSVFFFFFFFFFSGTLLKVVEGERELCNTNYVEYCCNILACLGFFFSFFLLFFRNLAESAPVFPERSFCLRQFPGG